MKQPIVFTEDQLKNVVGIKIPKTIDEVFHTVYYDATTLEVYSDKGYNVVLKVVGSTESKDEVILVKNDESEVKVELKPSEVTTEDKESKEEEEPSEISSEKKPTEGTSDGKYERIMNENASDQYRSYTIKIPVGGKYNDSDFYDDVEGSSVVVTSPKTYGITDKDLNAGEYDVTVEFTDDNSGIVTTLNTKLIVE